MPKKKEARIGKLPPQYAFVLNPRTDVRFTRCPGCNDQMRQRTLPLLVHVDPRHMNLFVHTCRYCPACDLLLAQQDQLEWQMVDWFTQYDPSALGNDYVVIGTMERKAWNDYLREPLYIDQVVHHVHDFERVYKIEGHIGHWFLIDDTRSVLTRTQQIIDAQIYTLEAPDV